MSSEDAKSDGDLGSDRLRDAEDDRASERAPERAHPPPITIASKAKSSAAGPDSGVKVVRMPANTPPTAIKAKEIASAIP